MKLWTFKTTGTFYGLMTCSKIWQEYLIVLLIKIFVIINEDMDNSLSSWYNLLYFQLFVPLLWSSHYGWADTLHAYSMVQSPSTAVKWFAASQEIPRISRNPKVHYRTHKRPPLVSILDQPNPVHIPTYHLPEIHPNIIHPSTPWSPHDPKLL